MFQEKFGTVAHTGNAACLTDLCTTGLCTGVRTTLRDRGHEACPGCASGPATQREPAQGHNAYGRGVRKLPGVNAYTVPNPDGAMRGQLKR